MKTPFFTSHNSKQTGCSGATARLVLAAFLHVCVTGELSAQTIVVPNSLAEVDGNSVLLAPDGHVSEVRFLHIYDASQFSALSGPAFLTQFAYRPNGIPGPSGPVTERVRIYMSTSPRSIALASTTYAQNIGTNNILVFNGTLTASNQNLQGPGNTRQFEILLPLTTPFLYDPAAGNLVIDRQIVSKDGGEFSFDTVRGDPKVATIFSWDGSTAATGQFDHTPVAQFTFQPASPIVSIQASQVKVSWNSFSNVTYQVQYRSALTTNEWTSLLDCALGTGQTNCIVENVIADQPQRFYRVVARNCIP